MSYHDLQKLIRQSFKSSQLLTEDIDLGTKNLWVLQDEAPISYVKYYMTLDCQLKPESVLHQIYKAQINGVQIHYNLTLSYTIQTNGTRTRVYLTKPMEIVVRRSPGGVINTTFSYQQSPTVQIYSQSKTENPQIDDNKLNSIITQLKPKMTEYLEKIFPSISQIEDIEIFNNSSDVTYSNFQRPNLYIIPDSKVINKSNYQLPQCIVENLKKDIGEITNTNFFILTELLSNFSSAETQGNFTSFNNMHLMTEIKVENPLRGIILWEFSSKQNSKDYSVKFNFTIDHLYIKTEMKNIGGYSSASPVLELNVDVGKLQFKTSLIDVIENEEKFSQCISSIIAESIKFFEKDYKTRFWFYDGSLKIATLSMSTNF